MEGMNFSNALDAVKDGERISRDSWNGKSQFVYHVPAGRYPAQTGVAKDYFGEYALVAYPAYLAIKTVQETVVPWLASQTDLLAEDWYIVENGQ